MDLYSTHVDLTKGFDRVSQDGLWKMMVKCGCPEKFILMVHQFHDGFQARVPDIVPSLHLSQSPTVLSRAEFLPQP